jgi:hypothetical protein
VKTGQGWYMYVARNRFLRGKSSTSGTPVKANTWRSEYSNGQPVPAGGGR